MGLLDALRDPQFRSDLGTNARQLGQSASNTIAEGVTMPVDALAWLLRRGRVNVPQNPVGGSEWAKQQGLMADVPAGAPKVAGETLGLLAPMAGTKQGVNALATALRQGGENLSKARTMNPQTGAIVWHGSPHKFDKFDASKIGTGEGAQAYGHGLYLAESPDVAKSYQKLGEITSIGGKPVAGGRTAAFDAPDGLSKTAVNYLGINDWNVKKTLDDLGASYAEAKTIGDKSYYMDMIRQVKQIPQGKIASEGGSLYKVDLPDEQIAKMLDWDKPLSQQPKGAQTALAKLDPDMYHPSGGDYDPTELGQMIYQRLAQKGQDAAATSMRGAGIPGIRYLDGGSRGAGQGSSNFVVFPGNENMLKILERNGQPLGLLGDMNRPGRYTGKPIVNAPRNAPHIPVNSELFESIEKQKAKQELQNLQKRKERNDDEMRIFYEEIYGPIAKPDISSKLESIMKNSKPYYAKALQDAKDSGLAFSRAFTNSGKYVGNQ